MKLKRLLIFAVGAVLLLCLASCNGNNPAETTAPQQEEQGPLVLIEGGVCDYTILVSANDDEAHGAAADFKAMFRDKTNIDLPIVDDWRTNEPKPHEIVIGETDRENTRLTDEMKQKIWRDGYVIMTVGGRLWICGENGESTAAGVKYFIDNYVLDAESLVLESNFSYTQERIQKPSMQSFTILGNDVSEYVIARNKSNRNASNMAEELRDNIWEHTGAYLKIEDLSTASSKKIVLDVAETAGRPNYTVKTEGEALFLSGSDKDYLSESIDFIYREYFGYRLYYGNGNGDFIDIPESSAIEELDVTITYNNLDSLTLAGKDISEYVIVYDPANGASPNYAATEIQNYIYKTTGVFLTLEKAGNALLTKPQIKIDYVEDMGEDFSIKTDDTGLILSGGKRGIVYSVYNFLEDYVGWIFLPSGAVLLEDGDVSVESLDVEYNQYFDYRAPFWCASSYHSYAAQNMINYNNGRSYWGTEFGGWYGVTGNRAYHTFSELLGDSSNAGSISENPCMYNEDNYIVMLANARKLLRANPNAEIISVSANDAAFCQCDKCQGKDIGGNTTDGLLRFVNRMTEDLIVDYPNLMIHTLAYGETQATPKVIMPHKNVIVQLATIRACYQHPLEDRCCDANKETMYDLEQWSKICDNLWIWDYTCDNFYYSATFPNFDVIRDNIRTYYEHNAVGIFCQGNAHNVTGEFGDLRSFLLAKIMENPYMTDEEYDEYINKFLRGFYGDGWQYIRNYLDFLMESSNKMPHYGIYAQPEALYYGQDFIDREDEIEGWFEEALAATTDDVTYYHVKVLRVSFRYLKLYFTYDYTRKNGTPEEREALYAECLETFEAMDLENWRLIDNLLEIGAYIDNPNVDPDGHPRNWCPNRHGGRPDLWPHGMPGSDANYKTTHGMIYAPDVYA